MLSTKVSKETIASNTVKNGTLASGAVAAQISGLPLDLKMGAIVMAPATNSAAVFLGDSNVATGTGFPLVAGAAVILPVEELKGLYAVSVAAQTLNWLGY